MANVNKVILIGRLTRDPEVRTFGTGGKVANFGFAVTNRKKNTQTGQWEDEPMFIDCSAFNRGETGTLANLIETTLRKGQQVYLEGKLVLDTWDDKTTGVKRQKHKLVVDVMQYLEPRQDGGGGMSRGAPARQSAPSDYGGEEHHDDGGSSSSGGSEDRSPTQGGDDKEIPF